MVNFNRKLILILILCFSMTFSPLLCPKANASTNFFSIYRKMIILLFKTNLTVLRNSQNVESSKTVNITETSRNLTSSTNPCLKSNGVWTLNFGGFANAITYKAKDGLYNSGAIALYDIQGIRGLSPNSNYLVSKKTSSNTYYVTDSGTNFKIIGYKYDPNYSTRQSFLQKIYNDITNGYPVAVKVKVSQNNAIYVVAYGVTSKNNRTSGKLDPKDIYVIDTYNGKYSTLDNYSEYTTNGNYVLGVYDSTANVQTQKSFIEVAKACHKYLEDNNFKYNRYSAKSVPITSSSSKITDCSHYVSWVLYEYGYTELKGAQLNVQGIDNFCQKKGFTKITDLSKIQPGDILIWPTNVHTEIVSTAGDYEYTLGAGGDGSIADPNYGGRACVYEKPSYAYRVN